MTTNTQTAPTTLRNLYFTRTAVQLLWALTVIGFAATNPVLGATLLILYPLWDVACTIYDIRSSVSASSASSLYGNAAFGLLTAVGIAATVYTHPQYAVAIFGLWAGVAGMLQFVVGVIRKRQLGGQWAMILSGLQSLLAGVAYIFGGLHDKRHIKDAGGYAIFGAVYFLIGGILLNRKRGLDSNA